MISAWWLLLIIPATVVATVSYIAFSAYCYACKDEDDRWWEEKTLAEQEKTAVMGAILDNTVKTASITQEEGADDDPCQSCAYAPPSSTDGKPCSFCDPDDPVANCYEERTVLTDDQT